MLSSTRLPLIIIISIYFRSPLFHSFIKCCLIKAERRRPDAATMLTVGYIYFKYYFIDWLCIHCCRSDYFIFISLLIIQLLTDKLNRCFAILAE